MVRRVEWAGGETDDLEPLLTREWLVTNGLGGYASGTVSGAVTRRYHGFLVAALPTPLGRTMMLNHLSERLRLGDGTQAWLGAEERAGGKLEVHGAPYLREFRLEEGMPVWRYEVSGHVVEKRILMPHRQNTVHVNYRLVEGDGRVRLKLRPAVHFRQHEKPVSEELGEGQYELHCTPNRLELSAGSSCPPLRFVAHGERAIFTVEWKRLQNIFYRIEAARGYETTGDMLSPGYFGVNLSREHDATLTASTESWETIRAMSPSEAFDSERERRRRLITVAAPEAREGLAAELVLAADQFVIEPSGRQEDAARARAAGEDVRSVIAGYHWFTDWGRDTMISLEGLTLTTGRHSEAGWILRTFAHYVNDGLIPNMFPEGENEGLYHTADATLWFFHALDRYVETTGDRITLDVIMPTLRRIVEAHLAGTRFGIKVDEADGLLRQGEEGYQLTWMDAKCGDWVVTPRRGKAVEINALWYNALRLMERWLRDAGDEEASGEMARHAARCRESFNRRFWYEEGGHLYDVIDGEGGDDPACRPNQIFAVSLPNPVLEEKRWASVLNVVREKLLTPVGLRSLAPDHPEYKSKYYGDLRARDAAYHQGTVWGWLIGPFVDAWLKVHPDDPEGARRLLEGFVPHLSEACVGSISEIFDAEAPFTPRGCIAQAWSVAEVLRCWVKTENSNQ